MQITKTSPSWLIISEINERLLLWCFSVPELLGGKQLSATVTDLSSWVDYEFRVLAINSIGTGEPSKPSKKARTKDTRMYQKLLAFFLMPTLGKVVSGSFSSCTEYLKKTLLSYFISVNFLLLQDKHDRIIKLLMPGSFSTTVLKRKKNSTLAH